MFYKIVEVQEGMYINAQGEQFEIFEGQTVKCPQGTTMEQCGWKEYDSLETVLVENNLRENTELLNRIRGVFQYEERE